MQAKGEDASISISDMHSALRISLRLLEEIEAASVAMKNADAQLGEQQWIDNVSIEGAVGRPK